MIKALGVGELLGYELEIDGAASPLLDVANLHVGVAIDWDGLENHTSAVLTGCDY